MTETRQEALINLHGNLAHGGRPEDCTPCNNLATTLGWPSPPAIKKELTGEKVKEIFNRFRVGIFCNWNAIAKAITKELA